MAIDALHIHYSKFSMGQVVKDLITGFEGVIMRNLLLSPENIQGFLDDTFPGDILFLAEGRLFFKILRHHFGPVNDIYEKLIHFIILIQILFHIIAK